MILVTVGTQLPFTRLIEAMDRLAPDLGEPVIAQTGTDQAYASLETRRVLGSEEFSTLFRAARVVVSHAGIGSILSARRFETPLIVMPRRHDLGEHRNDHQRATARHVAGMPGIHVAWEVEDLAALLRQPDLGVPGETHGPGYGRLIARLRDVVDGAG